VGSVDQADAATYWVHTAQGFECPFPGDLALDLDRAPIFGNQEGREALRQKVRLDALLLASYLLGHLASQAKPWTARLLPGGAPKGVEAKVQRIADAYLSLWVDFCTLEARITGDLPAFEGIRLVRERQPVE
jgi:hypothetical protein